MKVRELIDALKKYEEDDFDVVFANYDSTFYSNNDHFNVQHAILGFLPVNPTDAKSETVLKVFIG